MSTLLCTEAVEILKADGIENCAASITKVQAQIKRYQERVRKHIEDNYVDFMPSHTSMELYLDEGERLKREAEHLLEDVSHDTSDALQAANAELLSCKEGLAEVSLGLRLSQRILKIDDFFQCVNEANANKEYLVMLDVLSKLKSLIFGESGDDVDRLFQRCDCYETIKVNYQIQEKILKQNLQQRFEQLVQFTEKPYPHAKCVTLQVSKDIQQLQDTVMALFQARYNPSKMCDFLLHNCLEPLILKPVSVEYIPDGGEYLQLTLSYSLKELGDSLRPSYKQVFENIRLLLQCLEQINVCVSSEQYVFGLIGDQIKEPLLQLLVNECLMHAIPETMDEFRECTLVEDVHQFEQVLADTFLINTDEDHALADFCSNYETHFRERFCHKLLKSARELMQKDLQDMIMVATENTVEVVANNAYLFPRCMVSKSTLELIKLLERILRQSQGNVTESDSMSFVSVIGVILETYVCQVPQLHEKLLESIPQQSALFHNNCLYLAFWLAEHADSDIPSIQALVKTLQSSGTQQLQNQVAYQQKLLLDILHDFDPTSDTHTLGAVPLKLVRQCLRQLDLLRNVWQQVLSDVVYNRTFCELINDFSNELIRRVMGMEDISATVAHELSELFGVVLEKAPALFADPHVVLQVSCWMKLQQLKVILNASLHEITELWCEGAGILTANYKADEIRHLIRALFQNTDRRAQALTKII